MIPTIANANLLKFRNSIRPELVANTAGTLKPLVSQVKDSLNSVGQFNLLGNQTVPSKDMYADTAQYNTSAIPYGDLVVGNADQALLDISQYRPPNPEDFIDLGLLGVDAFFPARGAVKLTGKALTSPFAKDIYANIPNEVNRLTQKFTGVDLQPEIFIKSTPKNIDPRVGTRFEKEYVGDLVTPENITGKELEGATILTKPSDTTSRGEKIKSISDEFFEQQPPTTEGGFDFALSKKNIAEGKYYGSGLEQVDTDTRRMIQAFRENKAQGGSGRMMFTPSTMGTYSESFSTMPFENLMPILANAKPEAIAKVNNEIRQIYPEFSGLNTPAGTNEILNHGNLRKLAMERLRTKSAQENLGYNAEDLYNAVRSERFVGVGKNMIGDTLVEMDTALLQRADDMLNDAGITNLSQSKEARKARSPEQNAVLDEVYAMFRKDMGDSHRTYKVANTGATENRFTLDANLPLIEVAGDNMINDLMRGKIDYSIDPNKTYSSKVTPDEAQNIIHTGHKNVGLFIDPARAKRIDNARKSGQFDRNITSIFDDFIK